MASEDFIEFGEEAASEGGKGGRKRGEARPSKKNTHLDGEWDRAIAKEKRPKPGKPLTCWRCKLTKQTAVHYNWSTSQGVKEICNGCHGNILSKKPKVPKPESDVVGAEPTEKKRKAVAESEGDEGEAEADELEENGVSKEARKEAKRLRKEARKKLKVEAAAAEPKAEVAEPTPAPPACAPQETDPELTPTAPPMGKKDAMKARKRERMEAKRLVKVAKKAAAAANPKEASKEKKGKGKDKGKSKSKSGKGGGKKEEPVQEVTYVVDEPGKRKKSKPSDE